MNKGDHEFQVSADELEYLKQMISTDQSLVRLFNHHKDARSGKITIQLDRADAEKLRTCLTRRLAEVGFDRNYALSERGRMLEELIDRFYLP